MIRNQRFWILMVATLVCVGVLAPPASAKKKPPPSRTVTGEVMDESNNPIVGATVEITDLNTGKQLSMFSSAGGRYQFSGLKPTHDYEVRATHKGRQSETRKASSLDEDNRIVLNLVISAAPKP
jgi:Carboxypeptidase regulatory-like domain